MAALNTGTLKRTLATRRQRGWSEDRELDSDEPSPRLERSERSPRPEASPRTERRAQFDSQTYTHESQDLDNDSITDSSLAQADSSGEKTSRNWCFLCRIQVESKVIRFLFRICAVINLLSLVFSAPLFMCPKDPMAQNASLMPSDSLTDLIKTPSMFRNSSEMLQGCYSVFVQFSLITVIDFTLAVFYTLQTLARIEYAIYLRRNKKTSKPMEVPEIRFGPDNSPIKDEAYASILRLVNQIIITLTLWYSVGIGVYRTHTLVNNPEEPRICWAWYICLSFRLLSIFTAVKLLRYLALVKSSNFREILDSIQDVLNNLKNNTKLLYQLGYVTFFYLFFIYVFALFGVQWIGGLDSRCVHNESGQLSIPVTHCDTSSDLVHRVCYNDSNFQCQSKDNPNPVRIDARNEVYLGQFRTILDSMFAVYEASSWELWIFMFYNAFEGAPQSDWLIAIFYLLLFAFLVIFIQQSIFLVVIVESFADLRVESSSDSSKPITNKPAIVLSDPSSQGQSSEVHLTLVKKESSSAFQRKFNKYYHSWWRGLGVETLFIALVAVDAVFYATKHSAMSEEFGKALFGWQIAVSIIFLLEIVTILAIHVRYKQPRLFFQKYYFWYLMIVAVGSMLSAALYRPAVAGSMNVLVVFQAARLPRILRLPRIKEFFVKVFGNGSRLLLVTLVVITFLACFSIIAVQVFGYLPTEEECERTGTDQFSNFIVGFQSMFQLVTQEGWTELMGDVMCYRNTSWVFINLGFIILHLLGSLILLNFFVAVILDNLDYDEETKKQKLEEDLKKRKVEKVPRDLKIFKYFGQKTISGPKISSIEVPNLTEADVRNFYNVGEATDFPVSYEPEQPNFVADTPATSQEDSVFSDIDLLTEDKSQLLRGKVPSQQGWYYGIQGILNYVKAFRQHNQAVEGNRRGLERGRGSYGGGVGQGSSSRDQSEYEEYREKYRLFDSALFCLPPDHTFRRVCKKILTYRVLSPKTYPGNSPTSSWRQLPRKWLSYVIYFIRLVLSSVPLFYWVINLISIATLIVQLLEFITNKDNTHPTYTWSSDLVFVVATFMELLLKVIVNGVFFNPNGALRTVWGVLDWLILLATWTVMIIYMSVCGTGPSYPVTFNPAFVNGWMLALLFIRALRPLRIISLFPSMRRVILDVLEGWRSLVLALTLFVLFLFLFANLGVHLFTGKNSPQEFCNDPNMKTQDECVGEFEIYIDISPHERIPTDETAVPFLVPRVWYDVRRDFRFDHAGVAMLTLFQVLTTEGWPQVRNLFGSESLSKKSGPSWVMSFYIHVFVFIGVNIVLQLFVGIVVNNYNEHKPNHSALLTVSQKRWSDLVERIALTRPIKKPPEPRNSWLRQALYHVFLHRYYRNFATLSVVLNSAVLWVPWTTSTGSLKINTDIMIYLSIAFSALFILELILKMIAIGLNYFNSWRNLYDFVVALFSVCFIVLAIYYLVRRDGGGVELSHVRDIALFLAVFRLFTIHMKYRVFQNLLETVVKTIYRSLPLLGVLLNIVALYAIVGHLFFANVRSGEAIDYSLVNFNGFYVSVALAIRTITGEDWFQILWDTMVDPPYCSHELGNCGNWFIALVWFISFYILVSFFLINVVIAVLLENFSIFYEDDDTELSRSVVKDFKQNWFHFDRRTTGKISSTRVKLFLRMLRIKDFYTYKINENGIKERQKSDVTSDPLLLREMAEELHRDHKQLVNKTDEAAGGSGLQQEVEPNIENHSFQNVLKMVAYRAEDISKRLVPHELYLREELEQSVQFDVAEDCIFKWIKRFVKPVIAKQERQRRQTVAQLPRAVSNRDHPVLWGAPSLDVPEDNLSDAHLSAADSDDDIDPPPASLVFSSLQPASLSHLARSDDEMELDSHVSEKERNLARSYAKLAQLGPPVEPGKRDKWHDWIKMQSEWMDRVETDPDNYFDDYL